MSSTSSDSTEHSAFEVILEKEIKSVADPQEFSGLSSQMAKVQEQAEVQHCKKGLAEKSTADFNSSQKVSALQTQQSLLPQAIASTSKPLQEPAMPVQIPESTINVEKVTTNLEEINLNAPSTSPSSAGGDDVGGSFLGWISKNTFITKVAEKAKSSVDSMITTLDPGMKEYLHAGGDVSVVVACTDHVVVSAVREAFIDVFGRATVKGVESLPSSVAKQPFGAEAAISAAKERIFNIRTGQTSSIPQNQVIVSVESLISEVSPQRFYELGYLMLDDPVTSLSLDVYTQSVYLPSDLVNRLKFETPSDYPYRNSGFSLSIGQLMSNKLQVLEEKWHESWIGLSRHQLLYSAAFSLAHLYKSQNF